MSLLDTHIGFVEALRSAGLSVSLAEGLDAISALEKVRWHDRETVRAAYAATLVKRQPQRVTFDAVFDIYYPRLIGSGVAAEDAASDDGVPDTGAQLQRFREALAEALASGDQQALQDLAVEAVARFGAMPGRGPGLSSWSAYTSLQRVSPAELMDRLVQGLLGGGVDAEQAQKLAGRRIGDFTRLVEGDARRRIAEEKGPEHVTDVTVRPTIDRLDFTAARRSDLEEMRREIYPLARRLAARLTKEQHAQRRGPLDVRRTVRASIATGGVPLTTHHRPRRPHRTDLVVLCDVSGSVANFAQFTLMLVFALREAFSGVRAFTFVDDVVEVSDTFRPGADVVEVMESLAASISHAALWGRTNYGRALTRFAEEHADAIGPRSSLLVLGDARSNYSDLALPVLSDLAGRARHAWWLNPEHPRHWGTGDSAADSYGEIVPMVECRNLAQLGEFVHEIVVSRPSAGEVAQVLHPGDLGPQLGVLGAVGGLCPGDVDVRAAGAAVEDDGQPVGRGGVDQRAEEGDRVGPVLQRQHAGGLGDPRHLGRRCAGRDDLVDHEALRAGGGRDLRSDGAAGGRADQHDPGVVLGDDLLDRADDLVGRRGGVCADETQPAGVGAERAREVGDVAAGADALHGDPAVLGKEVGHQLLERPGRLALGGRRFRVGRLDVDERAGRVAEGGDRVGRERVDADGPQTRREPRAHPGRRRAHRR